MTQRIYIASDHAGLALKESLKNRFQDIAWVDLGPFDDQRVDYPDFAKHLTLKVSQSDFKTLGVLICGSGQGMAIAANKQEGIRAALCWNEEVAKLAREHNDANVLCLSSRLVDTETNFLIFQTFLNTKFEGGRHLERVKKIEKD